MRIEYLFLLPPVAALVITSTSVPVFASTGMNDGEEGDRPGEGDTQRDRVGNPDEEGEEGIEDDEKDRDGPDDEGEENCWSDVSSDAAQRDDSQPGLGEHSSDPVPGDEDN